MKTLIALLLFAVPLWAQDCVEVIVKPVVSMATIDSIRTVAGSKTLEMRGPTGNRFESVVVGQAIWGTGIPWGTVVAALPDTAKDSLVTMSKAATVTDTSGTTILGRAILNFGYYSATSYTAGDWVGIPFEIPNAQGKLLFAVTLLDSSDTADSLDILLFNDPNFASPVVRDTMPMNVAETGIDNVVGIVKVRTKTDLGDLRLFQETALALPVGADKLYGRLICRNPSGMLLTSTQCIIIRFKFI